MKKVRILLLTGIILLMASVIWGGRSCWYVTQGEQAMGTVIDLVSNGRYVHPVIQFTTNEETQVQKKLSSGGNGFSVGDKIRVYYNPTHPEKFRVDWFTNLWLGPLLLGIAGVINLGLGITLPYFQKQRTAQLVSQKHE